MNLLCESVPDYITVNGEKYNIKTNFALWVSVLIALESEDTDRIAAALVDVFTDEIPNDKGIAEAVEAWMFPSGKSSGESQKQGGNAIDFEVDGNIIYCELWRYYPELMKKGISFHEGMELIKTIAANKDTELWHRAYARCGDFSKMGKEERQYWQKQRLIYALKEKNTGAEEDFCDAFWK